MTAAERSARRYQRLRKSINKRRRAQYKLKVESEAKKAARAKSIERRLRSRAAVALADGFDLRPTIIGVADSSVPLILTTAPDDDLACEWLGQWAAAKLIPGGSLICFTVGERLPRDMAILSCHLRYWWLIIQQQPFNGRWVEDRSFMSYNKLALWYVKETRRGRSMVPDVLREDILDDFLIKKETRLHVYGVGPLIEHLTDPGDMIVDPFAVTILAVSRGRQAAAMGRRWIGATQAGAIHPQPC
jgi:hypothetical protein